MVWHLILGKQLRGIDLLQILRFDHLVSVEDVLVESIGIDHRVVKVQFGNVICPSQEGIISFL